MKVNKRKFRQEIFMGVFFGNYTRCAGALGLKIQHLHKFLTSDSEAGADFLGNFAVYCEKRDINFWDFIILPCHSTMVDQTTPDPPNPAA